MRRERQLPSACEDDPHGERALECTHSAFGIRHSALLCLPCPRSPPLPPPPLALQRPPRSANVAVDAYRGFVMFLMMAEVLRLAQVAAAYPGNWLINVLAYHQTHVAWAGASLHDLIQPSFSLLVGVALPYSFARRVAAGGYGKAFAHAVWRSLILIALGVFLRSVGRQQTNFTFEDTLSQIGLGYPFLFLLATQSHAAAVDRARRDPVRLLARVGALPCRRTRLRLRRGRRPGRLDAPLLGLHGALEQERQPRARIRHVVPEPVPARAGRLSPTAAAISPSASSPPWAR